MPTAGSSIMKCTQRGGIRQHGLDVKHRCHGTRQQLLVDHEQLASGNLTSLAVPTEVFNTFLSLRNGLCAIVANIPHPTALNACAMQGLASPRASGRPRELSALNEGRSLHALGPSSAHDIEPEDNPESPQAQVGSFANCCICCKQTCGPAMHQDWCCTACEYGTQAIVTVANP